MKKFTPQQATSEMTSAENCSILKPSPRRRRKTRLSRPRTRHKRLAVAPLIIEKRSSASTMKSGACFGGAFLPILCTVLFLVATLAILRSGALLLESEIEAPRTLERRANVRSRQNQQQQQQQQAQQPQSRSSQARITDTDLLPFSDFNVHQPAFSEIIKSWPPTTLSSLQREPQAQREESAAQQRRHEQRHRWRQPQSSRASAEVHNHLNEDLDDTIVTADESFELDELAEPPTWVNYLGELGDFVYAQLRQFYESSPSSPFAHQQEGGAGSRQAGAGNGRLADTIEELLDDLYYDQYENSQVLYYGPQLAREGDIVEIGCYLPRDQPAEWTKSGRALNSSGPPVAPLALAAGASSSESSLSIIRRSEFLGAKQNFSLKIFEARQADSGNYRCNRMSRKYHKLVVVPGRLPSAQLYAIQQRLLHVVRPQAAPVATSGQTSTTTTPMQRQLYAQTSAQQARLFASAQHSRAQSATKSPEEDKQQQQRRQTLLVPGHVIVEGQPLLVYCNISDEFVLRRLREQPQFQLAWYKNGRLIRASQQRPSNGTASVAQQRAAIGATNQRLQFLGANGRQMYISAPLYSDAGDYLCSWASLPARQMNAQDNGDEPATAAAAAGPSRSFASNPLAAGSLHQLLAPVKLRPFKSAYNVRAGAQLRLVCQLQRGYPQAQVSWYVGNRLVDGDFLREHARQFRLLQYAQPVASSAALQQQQQQQQQPGQLLASAADSEAQDGEPERLVEINPIPSQRQQMQLTAGGRGSWLEFRDLRGPNAAPQEKYAIDTADQQLRYMRAKLAQLASGGSQHQPTGGQQTTGADQQGSSAPPNSWSTAAAISVLIVNKLEADKHASRYSCRATTRANTDEVTTVIRVKDSATYVVKPTTGAATLIPGQALHFECGQVGIPNAQFLWSKRNLGEEEKHLLQPNEDDTIEIHNERLTLTRPSYSSLGDYICSALPEDGKEFAVIKVRAQPYIQEFGVETSHTGKSATINDGQRLELTCHVPDESSPVNITWLRSDTSDDERLMVPLPEVDSASQAEHLEHSAQAPSSIGGGAAASTFAQPLSLLVGVEQAQQTTTLAAYEKTYSSPSIFVERVNNFTRRLIIDQVGPEHRGHYTCLVDNGVTERSRKTIFIRVKDKIIALWPFLAILAELFILFTIIQLWETRKAYKESQQPITTSKLAVSTTPSKQMASAATPPVATRRGPAANAFESVPLNSQ